ncbi:MAG: ribonuclease R [Bacilli bacterium]
MKERILEIIKEIDYKAKTFDEFVLFFNLTNSKEKDQLRDDLDSLVEENIIAVVKNRYNLLSRFNMYIGELNLKKQGYGFFKSDELVKDVYIASDDINGALDKDIILVKVEYNHKINKDEARVLKIIKRSTKYVYGELYKISNRYFIDSNSNILVEVKDVKNAKEKDFVKAEVIEYYKDKLIVNVIDIYGKKDDIGIEITTLALKYNFNLSFDESVLNEVNNLKFDLSEIDKRKAPSCDRIFTIDGATAKDLDDAIGIKFLDNGNKLLGVYIADVSFYVKENSFTDLEALERGTSVYPVDRVIPMLPERLSNDLCSLLPDTLKLVMACEMEIDFKGEVVRSEIFPSYIKSCHRLTYEEINLLLDGYREVIFKYKDIAEDLFSMEELAGLLNEMRNWRGAIDFDLDEAKIILDETGEVEDIIPDERGVSERIIEEFMLIANETVASTIKHMDLPFIYRIHEQPNYEKIRSFAGVVRDLGYSFKLKNNKVYPKELQKLLEKIDEENVGLKNLVLRMMAKARYSHENLGHFGLASETYTHFTAPIRRYPDLLVHRLLRRYLVDHDVLETDGLNKKISEIAKQSSQKEREADELEYEVADMLKAEYMEKYIGEKFMGVISSITSFGMFVTVKRTIEGFVSFSSMTDDYYTYNPVNMTLEGRKNKVYRIGDKVEVMVTKASKKEREIDFKIINRGSNNGNKKYRQKQKSKS